MLVAVESKSDDITFNPEMEKEEQNEKNHITNPDSLEMKIHKDKVEDVDGAKMMKSEGELDLSPQVPLEQHVKKDKDDERVWKWNDKLLGRVDVAAIGESKDPEVQMLSLSIICPGRADLSFPFPVPASHSKSSLFTLKEGTPYRVTFSFTVSNSIVSGLKYANTLWKTGIRVDHSKVMLGTFSPKQEPYKYELDGDTTPSGMFGRGSYSARTKVIDDGGKCYLDISYHFEIQKKWPSP